MLTSILPCPAARAAVRPFAAFTSWLRDVCPRALPAAAVTPDALGFLASPRSTSSQRAWALAILAQALEAWPEFASAAGIAREAVLDSLLDLSVLVDDEDAGLELVRATEELELALGL